MAEAPVEASARQTPAPVIDVPGWGAWAVRSVVLPWLVPAAYLLERLFLPLGLWVFLVYLAWIFVGPILLYRSAAGRARELLREGAEADAARDLGRYGYVAGCSLAFYGLFLFLQPMLGDVAAREAKSGYRTYQVEITLGVFVVYAALSAIGYWYLRRGVRRMNLAREPARSADVSRQVTDADDDRFG